MKVKDIVLMLSCVDPDLDVRIGQYEGRTNLICRTEEDEIILAICPRTGEFLAHPLIRTYIAMAGSALNEEEEGVRCSNQ